MTFRIVTFVLVLLAMATAATPIAAQEPPVADSARIAAADTIPSLLAAEKSPGGAFVRSLVLPGWGQAWTGAPARGAIYFALEGASVWMLYKSRTKLSRARRADEFLRSIGELGEEEESGFAEGRARQVEDWTALSVFLLFFSAADAYVAAHLADVGERVEVIPDGQGAVRLEARIPLPFR